MKLSNFRVGNWMLNENGKPFQLTIEDLIKIFTSSENEWPKPISLNVEWLMDFDFECDRIVDKENDQDGIWIKHGITIYQDFWEQKKFNYGTYVKGDGEFKGGFSVEYVHQLQNIVEGFSDGRLDLVRNCIST